MVPQSRAIPVLITRPQPQADRFAHALRDRYGDRVQPVVTPLMEVRHIAASLPAGPFGAVVLTSESGARAAAAMGASLPRRAYCVGERTASVAAGLGFDPVSADGDADALLTLLRSRPQDAPFLHLRGRDARGDLVVRLNAQGLPAQEVVVYAQEPLALTVVARAALQGTIPVVVPLFSPRSAQLLRDALGASAPAAVVQVIALSRAVAQVWGEETIPVARAPTQAELFLAMDRFIVTG